MSNSTSLSHGCCDNDGILFCKQIKFHCSKIRFQFRPYDLTHMLDVLNESVSGQLKSTEIVGCPQKNLPEKALNIFSEQIVPYSLLQSPAEALLGLIYRSCSSHEMILCPDRT